MRAVIRPLIKNKIGNGDHTFLWHDNWHPKGPLALVYGERVIYDAAIPSYAKVNSIINGSNWDWPIARSPIARSSALIDIKRHMTQLHDPRDIPDTVVWIPSADGNFQVKSTWRAMFPSLLMVPWHNLVWFAGAVPRHSFLMWLAVHLRLATHDRIHHFTPGPLACVFCVSHMETHDHLFFQCPYTCFIWQGLLQRMEIQFVHQSWEDLTRWASQKWKKRKTPSHVIPKMCLGTAVYLIWRERNERTFGTKAKPKETLLGDICSHMSAMINIRWKGDPHIASYLDCWS